MFPIIPCSLVLVLVLVLVLWLDGKISYISRNNGSGKSELSFTYDAMGNRVEKTVNNDAGTWTETEYYVRDAQGNVMAIYKKNVTSGQMNYILTEQHMYGSSRLGVDRRNVDVIAASSPSDNVSQSIKRGEKHYELSNHLGNVLATVSDKKIAVMNGANLSYYRADVVSYSDYYPFGAPMTERTAVVTPTDVRYGFNSQQRTDEISGSGNHYTAEYWEYDSRLGRRLNLDPMFFKYPWQSPYSAFNNNPIRFSDPLGLEGEDEVAPAGHKEYKGANNGALYLPSSAKVETNLKTQETALVNNPKVKIKAIEGTVRSFTIGEDRYVAAYNSKSGSFMGYRNFQTGAMYQNPEGMRTTGTTAKVGFGETRGLYPSKGGTKVGGDPSTWDYQASQELMSARGAIEVVAKRNTSVHPGATPSTNPNNIEYQQRQFAITENFPDVDPAIANDPTVTNFYNASSPDYIPGNSYVDQRYWNISIVKSYGPFYNASSMGDTQQGVPVYIIFYSVKPK